MIRTWQFELAFVGSVLGTTTALTSGDWRSWLASAAVVLSFAHAQIAERLAEREAARPAPTVACHGKARVFFVAKEVLWVAFFVAVSAWPALVGCALFIAYPLWRRAWRRYHPIGALP